MRGSGIGVRFADDSFRKRSCVSNALDNRRGAAVCVACAPDVLDVGLKGGAFALHLDAVIGHELGVDLLADRRDDEVARNLKELAGSEGGTPAGSVGLAELHLF